MPNKLTVTYKNTPIINEKEIEGNAIVSYKGTNVQTISAGEEVKLNTKNKYTSDFITIAGEKLNTKGKIIKDFINVKVDIGIPAPYYIMSEGDTYYYSNVLEPTENDWIYADTPDDDIFTEIACIRDVDNPSNWTYIAFGYWDDSSVYWASRNIYVWNKNTKRFEYFMVAETNPTFIHNSADGSIIGFSFYSGTGGALNFGYINNNWISRAFPYDPCIIKDCAYDGGNFYTLGIDPMTSSDSTVTIMVNGEYACSIELSSYIDVLDSLSWVYDGNFDKFSYWSLTGEVFIYGTDGNMINETVIDSFYNWPALDIRNNRYFFDEGRQGFSALDWDGNIVYGGVVYDPYADYFDTFGWACTIPTFDKVEWSFYEDDTRLLYHNNVYVGAGPVGYAPWLLATHLDDN